jgi:hypothetical protein
MNLSVPTVGAKRSPRPGGSLLARSASLELLGQGRKVQNLVAPLPGGKVYAHLLVDLRAQETPAYG